MASVYVKAFILTAIVFTLGISAGWYLDSTRTQAAQNELNALRLQAEEARVGMVFFETFKTDPQFCSVYSKEMTAQLQRVGRLGEQLEALREANKIDESYYALKRQYVLFNTELWLRAENLKKLCGGGGSGGVTTMLYFYPENSDCADCIAQARELLALKTACPESLWLFALPTDLDVTVVDMLKQRFAVTETPAIVAGGAALNGLQSAASLRERFPGLKAC